MHPDMISASAGRFPVNNTLSKWLWRRRIQREGERERGIQRETDLPHGNEDDLDLAEFFLPNRLCDSVLEQISDHSKRQYF
jgi:hypothetical protein